VDSLSNEKVPDWILKWVEIEEAWIQQRLREGWEKSHKRPAVVHRGENNC